MKTNRIFAASLLAADFTRIQEAVESINSAGPDWVHLDIMDGNLVPEITFGAQLVEEIRPLTDKPLDVHLMVRRPGDHIERFARAGSDYLTVHYENNTELREQIRYIHKLGCRAGVALIPDTPPEVLADVLAEIDLVLVMTVNPGYGGQQLIRECLGKVDYLSQIRQKRGYNYYISIDGGVNRDTYGIIKTKDVDVLVAGSAFFGAADRDGAVRYFKS
ncbi:MAG: ribulose-phosphate 3-epimerase [Spirochaetales bacterium]|nr:ribulose-phosphate 3-epimerase [Spirochaetales bacterium]